MKPTFFAVAVLALASVVGCSQKTELEKVRAEAEAAKSELAIVKAELELLKEQMAALQNPLPANSEEALKNAVEAFFDDVADGSLRGAYDSTSLAYRERTDLPMFEQFIEMHPALKVAATTIRNREQFVRDFTIKVRKLTEDNTYECDIVTKGIISTPSTEADRTNEAGIPNSATRG